MAQITEKQLCSLTVLPVSSGQLPLSEAKKVTDRSDISSTVSRKIQNSAKTHGRRQKASYSFGPARKVLEKTGLTEEEVRYLFAGDLLAQGIATSYGIMELQIPLFGLYGACPPAVKVSPWLPCVSVPVMPDV